MDEPLIPHDDGQHHTGADLHGLLTLVSPAGDCGSVVHWGSVVQRDVVVLFDTSGSMSGEPLEQARAVVHAFVQSLGERDRLEITQAILEDMPAATRFHVLAVGSAPNRTLTRAAARAGRGVERGVMLGEDPARVARELIAQTAQPLVVDLELSGSAYIECAPERLPDLFAASPAMVAVRLRPEGGELVVRGRSASGAWVRRIAVKATPRVHGRGEIVTLFAREKIEDLEMRVVKGEPHDRAIEELALRYRIASRMTSWIAVHENVIVDPSEPIRRATVPHELAMGLSVEGLGLRPPMAHPSGAVGAVKKRAQTQLGAIAPEPRSGSKLRRKRPAQDFDDEFAAGALEEVREAAPAPCAKADASELADKLERNDKSDASGDDDCVLHGRFLRLPDGTLVIEFVWNCEAVHEWARGAWQLPAAVELRWGAVSHEAQPITAASTRSGPVAPGAAVRLRVELPTGESTELPDAVAFVVAGVCVRIQAQHA